uniref:Uncharacterized protein n=1 Tax=Lepeophtheirus salmonis TaxID=72036 RepID=A0A0K2U6M9_LEPSM
MFIGALGSFVKWKEITMFLQFVLNLYAFLE